MDTVPKRLVLYDGQCGLCDNTVQWLLQHDSAGVLHFAALDSPIAQRIVQRHPELPPNTDSVLFVEQDTATGERLSWRSAAIFRIMAVLPPPWRWARVFGWFPPFLGDIGYRLVAATRYRVFGRLETCRVPRPEERSRFLA